MADALEGVAVDAHGFVACAGRLPLSTAQAVGALDCFRGAAFWIRRNAGAAAAAGGPLFNTLSELRGRRRFRAIIGLAIALSLIDLAEQQSVAALSRDAFLQSPSRSAARCRVRRMRC